MKGDRKMEADSLTLVEHGQRLDRAIREMWNQAMPMAVGHDGQILHDVRSAIMTDYLASWFVQALEIDCALAARWEA
jgi:hypothetical protein